MIKLNYLILLINIVQNILIFYTNICSIKYQSNSPKSSLVGKIKNVINVHNRLYNTKLIVLKK